MSILIFYTIVFLTTGSFFLFLERWIQIFNIYDTSVAKRKIHKGSVPPIGGVILFVIFLLLGIYEFFYNNLIISHATTKQFFSFYWIGSLLFFLGFLDDKFNLSYKIKLFSLVGLVSCSVLIDNTIVIDSLHFQFLGKFVSLENFSIFFTVFAIIIFINAFNMFDGINLQSGLYLVTFFLFFILKGIEVNFFLALLIPLIFFLFYNFKGKLFLGNGGSIFLPYVISHICIYQHGELYSIFPEEIGVLMIVPGLDLIRLFFLRIMNGRSPFLADSMHIHHHALRKFGYKKAVFFIFALTFVPMTLTFYFESVLILMLFQILGYFLLYRISQPRAIID
jgi:UDP-GlcNAc:undecaprenyl-phosphate GlcNAc-1-phosphate transferase